MKERSLLLEYVYFSVERNLSFDFFLLKELVLKTILERFVY